MNVGPLLFALTSACGYGAADFVGGSAGRRHSTWQVVFAGQLVGALALAVTGMLVPGSPNVADYGWAVVAGVGSSSGSLLLFRGLAGGHMALVAPISAVGAAVVPVVAGLAMGERPTWLTAAGLLGALPGIWLVSSGDAPRKNSAVRRSSLLLGGGAGVCFGVLFVALARMSPAAGTMLLAVNQVVGGVVTLVAASVMRHRCVPTMRALRWGAVAGALGVMGTLSFAVAARSGSLDRRRCWRRCTRRSPCRSQRSSSGSASGHLSVLVSGYVCRRSRRSPEQQRPS